MEVGEYKNQIKSERKAKQKQAREEGGAKEGKEGKKFKERLICYDLVRGFHIPVLAKVFGMPHLLGLKIHDNTEK